MRNDHLSRVVGVTLALVVLGVPAGMARASEPTPLYHQVIPSLPRVARATEQPITRDVFVATKLTSKPGPAVKVDRFTLLGVTAIPVAELQAKADASAGAALTPEQIDAVAEDIAKQYRAKGYPLAMVALVDVQGGVARLQVYEGKIANVRVEGAKGYTEEAVSAPFLDLPRNKPLTAAELESAARNLDDYPGLDVRVQALPAKTAGETDLVVKVTEQRLTGGVGIDNNGIEAIGRQRYRAELQWNSPSGWGDQLALSLMNTDMGGLRYARLGYSLPFSSDGLRAELSYALSEYESNGLVDGVLGPYTAFGKTTDIRIGMSNVVERGRSSTQIVDFYFQRLEGSTWVTGAPVVVPPPFDSSGLSLVGIGWFHASQGADGANNSLRVGFETNAQNNDGTDPSALLGQVRVELENLSGGNLRAYTRLRGVLTAGSSPVLKRFQLGGPDSIRAYDYAMAEGDGGIDATFELRMGSASDAGLRTEFVAFADAGYVASNSGTVTPTGSSEKLLGGAGLGLRFGAPGFEFAVEYAYPIGQHATPDGDDNGYFWGRLSVGLD